jgi:hypothetical protein
MAEGSQPLPEAGVKKAIKALGQDVLQKAAA